MFPTRLYLAGPMRGLPRYNFDAFHDAADVLRRMGYEIVNPAEMDLQQGFDPERNLEEQGFDLHKTLRNDFQAILYSDGLALLPGWEDSVGARIEVALACYAGLAIFELVDGQLEPLRTDALPKIGLPNETPRLWSALPGVKAIRLTCTSANEEGACVDLDIVDSETGGVLYEFNCLELENGSHYVEVKLDAEVRLDEEAA